MVTPDFFVISGFMGWSEGKEKVKLFVTIYQKQLPKTIKLLNFADD